MLSTKCSSDDDIEVKSDLGSEAPLQVTRVWPDIQE